MDGANHWRLFRHITIPLLSPVTFYLSLIGFIGTFKAFNHIYVMQGASARGGGDGSVAAIFNTFFKASQFGYATAQAMLLFSIILFLTYVQNRYLVRGCSIANNYSDLFQWITQSRAMLVPRHSFVVSVIYRSSLCFSACVTGLPGATALIIQQLLGSMAPGQLSSTSSTASSSPR
ncbi:MAG: ABC transporter permease subunit [Caldilineaceae bacterium]